MSDASSKVPNRGRHLAAVTKGDALTLDTACLEYGEHLPTRDRAIGSFIFKSVTSKIWTKKIHGTQWLFGQTGQSRHLEILRYEMALPDEPPQADLCGYIVTKCVPLIRSALRTHGGLLIKEGVEKSESGLLIGARGNLFIIDTLFSVLHVETPFAAIGQGENVAYGALFALQKSQPRMKPRNRIRLALEAAESHCDGVGGRFDILHVR